MDDINKVFLAGRLTRDPELKKLNGGTSVVEFGMAMNRKYKNKEGEKKEEVCFIDCRLYGKRAETINKYFKKGKPIMIEGGLRFSSWEEESGKKRSKLRVVADKFYFIDTKDSVAKEELEIEEIGETKQDFDNLNI